MKIKLIGLIVIAQLFAVSMLGQYRVVALNEERNSFTFMNGDKLEEALLRRLEVNIDDLLSLWIQKQENLKKIKTK